MSNNGAFSFHLFGTQQKIYYVLYIYIFYILCGTTDRAKLGLEVVYYMALWDACFSFYIKSFLIFRIIELPWRIFVFFIHLLNVRKISILLASSGSFTVKNDSIHSLFFPVLVANVEFAGFAPKGKYTGWTVSMETVCTAKS